MNGEIKGICHLHTFLQPGNYTVQSDRFGNTATVVVYSTSVDRENSEDSLKIFAYYFGCLYRKTGCTADRQRNNH